MSNPLFPQPWALLINECQRGLLDQEVAVFPGIEQQASERGIVPKISALAKVFRQRNLPVIHIHMNLREDFSGFSINNPAVAYIKKIKGLVAGSEQAEAMMGLTPLPDDHVVLRYSGMTVFQANHLDSLLRNLGVRTVVGVGVSTNAAIPGMVLGALDRNMNVIVAEDCIAGASAESHDAILEHMIKPLARVVDSDRLIKELLSE